jgi:hypothetical protein
MEELIDMSIRASDRELGSAKDVLAIITRAYAISWPRHWQ